jgi:hypothetical protein
VGNPSAGVLVLLLALYLLLAFFQGRLEWLFRLNELTAAGDTSGPAAEPRRPSTTGR